MDRRVVQQFKEVEKMREEQAAKLKAADTTGGTVNKDCRDFARFVQAKHPAVFAQLMSKFKNACPSVWAEFMANRAVRKAKRKQGR